MDQPQLLKSLCIVNSAPEVKRRSRNDYWQWFKRWSLMRALSMGTIGKALGAKLFPKPEQASLRQKNSGALGKKTTNMLISPASMPSLAGGVQERLSKVSCPTLIVSADRDYTPVALKETYVKLLPDARLVVIADSRHATPLDQPERFNQTLLEFLTAVDTTTQDH